jgi:hypothetical protein
LLQPFEHGADLIFHSATKFLCGHGTAIGGLLVDGGTFDWQEAYEKTGRFAELCEPYDGFHGMVFTEESTVGAFSLRARRQYPCYSLQKEHCCNQDCMGWRSLLCAARRLRPAAKTPGRPWSLCRRPSIRASIP